jgi:hypothetical protein
MSDQKRIYKKALAPVLSAMLLGGCASSSVPTEQVIVGAAELDKPLYLIGSFNWWEVDEQYVLVKGRKNTYSTRVELIADGQPYDFIIADAKWSPGYTCGYHTKSKDHLLQLDKDVDADCTKRTNNFQFKPIENGVYQLTIDFSRDTPKVVLEQYSS